VSNWNVGSTTNENIQRYFEESQRCRWKATTPEAYRQKAQKTLSQYVT
jgi:hypothetical protein